MCWFVRVDMVRWWMRWLWWKCCGVCFGPAFFLVVFCAFVVSGCFCAVFLLVDSAMLFFGVVFLGLFCAVVF